LCVFRAPLQRWNIPDLSAALPFNVCTPKIQRMRGAWGTDLVYGFYQTRHSISGKMGNYVIMGDSGLVISIVNNKEDHPSAIDYLEVFRRAIIKILATTTKISVNDSLLLTTSRIIA
jgi:hypothetical protein